VGVVVYSAAMDKFCFYYGFNINYCFDFAQTGDRLPSTYG